MEKVWILALFPEGAATASVTNTAASSSICPKNWQLPNYTGTKSFPNLLSAANFSARVSSYNLYADDRIRLAKAPYSFVISGSYRTPQKELVLDATDFTVLLANADDLSVADDTDVWTYFWTNYAYTYSRAGDFFVAWRYYSYQPGNNHLRNTGYPIRCVAR